MPWTTSMMESRKHAVSLVNKGVKISEAARLSGVSRQCLHKWVARYAELGDEGLADQRKAPKNHATPVSEEMKKRAVRLKKRHMDEGPKKIREYLLTEETEKPKRIRVRVPATSTIGLILGDAGLVTPRGPRRTSTIVTPANMTEAKAPNDVWAIDYKGEFHVGGTLCYPLTLTDIFSRYALAIAPHRGTYTASVYRNLWHALGTYGLPRVIRSDNGLPFVSTRSPAGLTTLGVMLIRLGIQRERIQPGKPTQNGRHERFHKSMKGAIANPPASSWAAQRQRITRYRRHFNETRPHESLNMKTPASVFCRSSRTRPATLPPIQHPRAQHILKVYGSGEITLKGQKVFLTSTLAGETVAVNEIADDIHRISFGPVYLGVFDLRGKEPDFEQAP